MDWDTLLSRERAREKTPNPSEVDKRNEFESDFGRVVFSPAVRRMHDKTQTFPLPSDDNVHTRLTHSLETQSVAQSLGQNLCEQKIFKNSFQNKIVPGFIKRSIPQILATTALCHDIGNPPFGHYGEKVISKYFKKYFDDNKDSPPLSKSEESDFRDFDGNAQGLRVLSKLQVLYDGNGLNLTYGTLAAFLKYPYGYSDIYDDNGDRITFTTKYRNKIGVFCSEKQLLDDIRSKTGIGLFRHPLAFLMEAADTICYLIMDAEDGANSGYFTIEELLEHLISLGGSEIEKQINEFRTIFKKLCTKQSIAPKFIKVTMLVNFRIFVIQKLVDHTIREFCRNLDGIMDGTYSEDIIKANNCPLGIALERFSSKYLFPEREIITKELIGESILTGLLAHFVPTLLEEPESKRAEKLLKIISTSTKDIAMIENPRDDLFTMPEYAKLRMIIDYITGMTDTFALDRFQKLEGITIA